MPDSWVDDRLLAGPTGDVVLQLGEPVERGTLRQLVSERHRSLNEAGAGAGSGVALHMVPSLDFIATLLAVWRAGAQAILLDHRLTAHETAACLAAVRPGFLVRSHLPDGRAWLRGFADVPGVLTKLDDGLRATEHALIQFSSGSTGPSKVIGRTADDLFAELDRYTKIPGYPGAGERMVMLGSMPHVLGLVGGLLHCLQSGMRMIVPRHVSADGILRAAAEAGGPLVMLGVPSQARLLAAVPNPPALPGLSRMITGGELVSDELAESFAAKYGAEVGTMYGMTEAGVIAVDVLARHRPALAPAPGHELRADGDELLLAMPRSPYVGLSDPSRWSDGWLHTRDAGVVDSGTGLVTVRGRLDALVSVGGLKVDLAEVELALAAAPGVADAVVVYDDGIQAYVRLLDDGSVTTAEHHLRERLAAYKRPRAIYALPVLPRTSSGKPVRNPAALSAARLAETAR
jgi:3-hydroxy-4-methylanthranilate adenylyltransferase